MKFVSVNITDGVEHKVEMQIASAFGITAQLSLKLLDAYAIAIKYNSVGSVLGNTL